MNFRITAYRYLSAISSLVLLVECYILLKEGYVEFHNLHDPEIVGNLATSFIIFIIFIFSIVLFFIKRFWIVISILILMLISSINFVYRYFVLSLKNSEDFQSALFENGLTGYAILLLSILIICSSTSIFLVVKNEFWR